jgi:hypothetical protein
MLQAQFTGTRRQESQKLGSDVGESVATKIGMGK